MKEKLKGFSSVSGIKISLFLSPLTSLVLLLFLEDRWNDRIAVIPDQTHFIQYFWGVTGAQVALLLLFYVLRKKTSLKKHKLSVEGFFAGFSFGVILSVAMSAPLLEMGIPGVSPYTRIIWFTVAAIFIGGLSFVFGFRKLVKNKAGRILFIFSPFFMLFSFLYLGMSTGEYHVYYASHLEQQGNIKGAFRWYEQGMRKTVDASTKAYVQFRLGMLHYRKALNSPDSTSLQKLDSARLAFQEVVLQSQNDEHLRKRAAWFESALQDMSSSAIQQDSGQIRFLLPGIRWGAFQRSNYCVPNSLSQIFEIMGKTFDTEAAGKLVSDVSSGTTVGKTVLLTESLGLEILLDARRSKDDVIRLVRNGFPVMLFLEGHVVAALGHDSLLQSFVVYDTESSDLILDRPIEDLEKPWTKSLNMIGVFHKEEDYGKVDSLLRMNLNQEAKVPKSARERSEALLQYMMWDDPDLRGMTRYERLKKAMQHGEPEALRDLQVESGQVGSKFGYYQGDSLLLLEGVYHERRVKHMHFLEWMHGPDSALSFLQKLEQRTFLSWELVEEKIRMLRDLGEHTTALQYAWQEMDDGAGLSVETLLYMAAAEIQRGALVSAKDLLERIILREGKAVKGTAQAMSLWLSLQDTWNGDAGEYGVFAAYLNSTGCLDSNAVHTFLSLPHKDWTEEKQLFRSDYEVCFESLFSE